MNEDAPGTAIAEFDVADTGAVDPNFALKLIQDEIYTHPEDVNHPSNDYFRIDSSDFAFVAFELDEPKRITTVSIVCSQQITSSYSLCYNVDLYAWNYPNPDTDTFADFVWNSSNTVRCSKTVNTESTDFTCDDKVASHIVFSD